MPDNITPVGSQVHIDPMQGVNMLSGVLGLKQQQLALQTGQAQLPGVQAQASQEQQRNQELSSLGQVSREAMDPKSKYWHGNEFDVDSYRRDATAAAPVYGGQAIDQHISAIKNVAETRRAFNALGKESNENLGNMLKGLGTKQGPITDADVDNFADSARSTIGNNPDARERLGMFLGQLRGARDPDARRQVAQNASAVLGGFSQLGSTTNAAGQIVNRNALSGQLSMPQQAGGGNINPTSSAVAGNTSLNVGASEGDISRANEVSGKSQSANAAVRLSKQVDDLARAINSGGAAKDVSKALQYLGFGSVAEARTQLQKDLGQLRGAVASRAGSDARASEILEGYPTDTTPENTIHYAMDYIRGTARQDLARADLLQKHGRAGFQMADTALTSKSDPLMHEFQALKTPEERTAFYKRNFKTKQEAMQFRDSVNQSGTRAAGGG